MPDAEAVYSGTLVAESLRAGAELAGIPLTVTKVCRVRAGNEPQLWTLIYFDVRRLCRRPRQDVESCA
jgi:hypothetical protein